MDATKKAGVVYVLHAQGTARIKIGHSATFGVRLATLQTASPYPLVVVKQIHTSDHAALEQRLHERFAAYRQHGEWFELPQDILLAFLGESFTEAENGDKEANQQGWPVLNEHIVCPQCSCMHLDMLHIDIRYREGSSSHGFNVLAITTNDDDAEVHVGGKLYDMPKNINQYMHINLQCQRCLCEFLISIGRHTDGNIKMNKEIRQDSENGR